MAEAFREAGNEKRAEAEEQELDVIQEFMPEPLSEEEVESIIDDAIADTLNVDKVRTGDLGGTANCAQFTKALVSRITNS